MWNQIINYRLY